MSPIFDKDVCPPFEDSNFSPSFLEGANWSAITLVREIFKPVLVS